MTKPSGLTEIERRVAVAKQLATNIRGYLGELTPPQWELPSACAEWQVRDVVAHLIGGAERQAESMERGRGGDSNPPAGFVPAGPAALSAANAQRDINRRNQLAGRFLESFDASYEALHSQFDSFADGSWDTLCWHARRGAMTAAAYVELRIQELGIHDWDIRSAFENDAKIDADCVPVLLDMTPRWLRMCFRPSAPLSKPVVYKFVVESGRSHMTVTGDDFHVDDGDASGADLTLVASKQDYLLFTYGRLSAADGINAGRLTVRGDNAHLDRFEVWFKGL
ncbi:MAG: maleylpyruvate isomerase family mycothiol-dependent enzyme [Chloroflexi bacterium]|nr:maleylpyruvate isomerase family mycothiol-dependent enzyme [Chloroflexota bacterium]MDA1271508.1 maleylpyruvate isomerase family mycothiol-dependent enzyme [Chloroflexota bacterium]